MILVLTKSPSMRRRRLARVMTRVPRSRGESLRTGSPPFGSRLLVHAKDMAREQGCGVMNLSTVEENAVLRNWYEQNGAVHAGTEKFDFFPFICGYMKIQL